MSAKNRDYDPMSEDGYDSKIPLHNDEAFQHGIFFDAKFIGSLEVPKPTSRVEIVAAMRRIRYEFKAKAVKKRRVNLSISVDGIKVCLWKKKKKEKYLDENRFVILQHPIYRVFYVSHDSQDLKIFSFIARDSVNNSFRCNVFKAYKKNEAMRIVRTIGQAFEVCHKLALQQRPITSTTSSLQIKSNSMSSPTKITGNDDDPPTTNQQSNEVVEKTERYLESVQLTSATSNELKTMNLFQSSSSSEFTLKHQMQFMQEQLQQMQNESELAFNQIKLIKEQLSIEIAARIDAQNKNAQLLQRNRELLSHIQQLLIYTNKLEMKQNNATNNFESMKSLPSRPTDLILLPTLFPNLTISGSSGETSNVAGLSSDSPDSGKGKEISSESISDSALNNNNSTKTFSILDDFPTPSMSINETDLSTNKTSHPHGAYSSTSASISSSLSSSSSRSSSQSKTVSKMKKEKSKESTYFEPLATSTTTDQHFYHQINSSTLPSFTNSAFTQSPHRTAAKEFDPFAK